VIGRDAGRDVTVRDEGLLTVRGADRDGTLGRDVTGLRLGLGL